MDSKNVLIAGATGMVGRCVLDYALANDRVATVTTIGRRPTGVTDPKLREVTHEDFTDFSGSVDGLDGQDVALFCLGAYTGALTDEDFRRVTVDMAVAFGAAVRAASPEVVMCLLSGEGADQTESSRIAFARYKGMAENALIAMDFVRVHLFRPGYIYPTTPRMEPSFAYRAFRSLYPLMRRIYPNIGISSEDLGRVMLDVGLEGTPDHASPVLRNRDIRRLAR